MQEECYDGCATEQDRQDALMTAIALDNEASALESDMSSDMASIWNEAPDPLGPEASAGGPSADAPPAFMRCSGEFWNFVGAAASTHAAAFTLIGLALAPAAIPGMILVGAGLAVVGGLAWMYSGGIGLRECAMRAY